MSAYRAAPDALRGRYGAFVPPNALLAKIVPSRSCDEMRERSGSHRSERNLKVSLLGFDFLPA